jgi:Neuraminidase (sialidase)
LSIQPAVTGGSTWAGLVSDANGANEEGLVYNFTTRKIGYAIGVTPTITYFTPVLTVGLNYHVVFSVTAGVGTLYVNGVSGGTVSAVPAFEPFYLGLNPSGPGGGFYAGLMDDVVYYQDTALSAAQALAHYNATSVVSSDPQVMHRYSNDNGKTWSPERWRPAGAEGKYATRVIWRQLGRSRTRIDEIVCADGTPWRLTEWLGAIDPGTGA